MTAHDRAREVKAQALTLGFDAVGITDLEPTPHAAELRRWLGEGMAGTMRYMHRQADRRLHPETIVPGATRAVVVLKNYYHPDPPAPDGSWGHVARYARGEDYHTSLAGPLRALADAIIALGAADTIARPFVDAGPVPERELAQRAGLGWIGKNTMLIAPRAGSFFFIATVLTDLDLALDAPFTADRCGTCRRCLDACPTDAFPEARLLDARRCISYLTIEHRGSFDAAEPPALHDWVFGCDVCQDVCPWNERFAVTGDGAFALDPALAWLDLEELDALTEGEFTARYGQTPLERPGLEGLTRNAAAVRGARRPTDA